MSHKTKRSFLCKFNKKKSANIDDINESIIIENDKSIIVLPSNSVSSTINYEDPTSYVFNLNLSLKKFSTVTDIIHNNPQDLSISYNLLNQPFILRPSLPIRISKCTHCGDTSHKRKSSNLCKFYKAKITNNVETHDVAEPLVLINSSPLNLTPDLPLQFVSHTIRIKILKKVFIKIIKR